MLDSVFTSQAALLVSSLSNLACALILYRTQRDLIESAKSMRSTLCGTLTITVNDAGSVETRAGSTSTSQSSDERPAS